MLELLEEKEGSLLKISLSLCRKTLSKHTCSLDQSPQHCPNSPFLRHTLTHSHSSLHTSTHKTHKREHTVSHSSLHTTENRAVRDRGEQAGAVLWCNGRKCWCFIWNWWSLVSAAVPGAGPLCAGCVNERSSRDWTGGAESQSIELLEGLTELFRDLQLYERERAMSPKKRSILVTDG